MLTVKSVYTVKEFCRAVCISPRQYYRLRATGSGPRVTILGGKHVITEGERLRWLEVNTERRWIDVR